MVSPAVWGPPTWEFFHTLSVKIREQNFKILGPIVLNFIKRICSNLPCPECSQHATNFFITNSKTVIDKKEKLIALLYIFHNKVNVRKKKDPFLYENMKIYQDKNLVDVYNNFIRVYNYKGNLNQINESFHRDRIIFDLKKFLMANVIHFTPLPKPTPTPAPITITITQEPSKTEEEPEKVESSTLNTNSSSDVIQINI